MNAGERVTSDHEAEEFKHGRNPGTGFSGIKLYPNERDFFQASIQTECMIGLAFFSKKRKEKKHSNERRFFTLAFSV